MKDLFSLDGRTAVVTGASGAIGGAIALGFARAGANLALVYHRNADAAERIEAEASSLGVTARTCQVDVTDADSVRANADRIVAEFGGIHILLNSAGGNLKSAVTDADTGFFDLAPRAIQDTMALNFMGGAVLPCLFHGARMVANEMGGAIINISSMNAVRPLEGRPAYAASKAAVSNFTQWLACHVARHYTPLVRVNAVAPGFFPNQRMRASLFNDDGSYNERARRIIDHTPMGRLGSVDDLVGTALWYASDASRFVTGTVTPVDGGFSAYGGV